VIEAKVVSQENLLLPNSPEELERFVSKTLGGMQVLDEKERTAIYSRVSSIDQRARTYSMEYQPDRSQEYAQSKNWKIVGFYEDPDRTGRNSRRPGLQAMIRDIKAGKINVVCVHRLDRLYRNLESLLKFIRLCKRYKVRLVSVTEQIDTDTWWGRLVLYVLGALAEMYIHQTSERTREVLGDRNRRGLANGRIPLGYCNGLCSACTDPNGPGYCPLVGRPDRLESQRGRIPTPHPIDQHVIPLIASLYKNGMSYREISQYLNEHDFQLPDGTTRHFHPKGVPGRGA
jgi:DNA invertase Pin-like site-specific DNA recombinase